ncbi:MAG: hypothetical protein WCT24_00890 [Patescibacteria group bacterium]
MLSEFFLICASFLLSLVQGTLLVTLPAPWNAIPLTFIVGVLVLHRHGPWSGILWFLSTGIFLPLLGFSAFPAWQFVLFGILGAFLVTRIITTRSVYALLGLGYLLYGCAALFSLGIFVFVEHNHLGYAYGDVWPICANGFWWLGIGLIFGFVLSRGSARLFRSLFLVRKSHVSV